MFGAYFTYLGNFVMQKYGEETWNEVRAEAGLYSQIYKSPEQFTEEEMDALMRVASEKAGESIMDFQQNLGQYMVSKIIEIYWSYIDPRWSTLDLLENLNEIMSRIANLGPSMPHADFMITRNAPDKAFLTYNGARRLCGLTKGIISGFASYYDEEIEVAELCCMWDGSPSCEMTLNVVKAPKPVASS